MIEKDLNGMDPVLVRMTLLCSSHLNCTKCFPFGVIAGHLFIDSLTLFGLFYHIYIYFDPIIAIGT